MALNFPNDPDNGESYTDPVTLVTYTYDDAKDTWTAIIGIGSASASGTVKTVNGVSPDASGEVTLSSTNFYAPAKDGTGSTGSWPISVTGSSASCTGNALTSTTASATVGTLTAGTGMTTTTFNGSTNTTLNVNSSTTNTASSIVSRGLNGEFAAGEITMTSSKASNYDFTVLNALP
jgi:hypothetical protein